MAKKKFNKYTVTAFKCVTVLCFLQFQYISAVLIFYHVYVPGAAIIIVHITPILSASILIVLELIMVKIKYQSHSIPLLLIQ